MGRYDLCAVCAYSICVVYDNWHQNHVYPSLEGRVGAWQDMTFFSYPRKTPNACWFDPRPITKPSKAYPYPVDKRTN